MWYIAYFWMFKKRSFFLYTLCLQSSFIFILCFKDSFYLWFMIMSERFTAQRRLNYNISCMKGLSCTIWSLRGLWYVIVLSFLKVYYFLWFRVDLWMSLRFPLNWVFVLLILSLFLLPYLILRQYFLTQYLLLLIHVAPHHIPCCLMIFILILKWYLILV